jgi:hypothetical protein
MMKIEVNIEQFDLWTEYSRFDRKVKESYGLSSKCHIRFREDRRGNTTLVYVIRRSKPSPGYEHGNFAVDELTLKWTRRQLGRVDRVYVALVEDWGDEVVNFLPARDALERLHGVDPYHNGEGNAYYWVDEDFEPFSSGGSSRANTGSVISTPPF